MSLALALQKPNMPYPMRPVAMADAPRLLVDVWAGYDVPYAQKLIDRIQKYAIEGRGLGIIVEHETRIIAYGQMTLWTQCAEISDLMVSEGYRSQGIGTAMIQYLTQRAISMGLTCLEIGVARSNARALALYERLGFVEHHRLMLNVGRGMEPVIYLRLLLNGSDEAV